MQRWLLNWEDEGVLTRWKPDDGSTEASESKKQRFVGVPTNQALPRHLAADINVVTSARIERIEQSGEQWHLHTEADTYGPFDTLVLNLPVPQLLALWPDAANTTAFPEFEPVHALMLRFPEPLHLNWSTSHPADHPILDWICQENMKPGRPDVEQWLVQSRGDWSTKHVDDELPRVQKLLIEAFHEYTGTSQAPASVQIHRWRYARPTNPLPEGSAWSEDDQLGFCGDAWGGGIEGALLSGADLAGRIMRVTR